jgi:ribonuclease Z
MTSALRVLVAVGLLALAAAAALLHSETLQDRVLDTVISRRVEADRNELSSSDTLNVVFCGTGSPIPDPDRGAACIAVFAGNRVFLVDVGPGAWDRIARLRLPLGNLAGVLVTHFHSDHIGGLGEVVLNSWAQGRSLPLAIYGGPGVADVAEGIERAYTHDSRYRVAHHGTALLPEAGSRLLATTVEIDRPDSVTTVLEDAELRIVAFHVTHTPVEPAYGYRLDYKGRSVIFSGDTMATPQMAIVGKDVDVMVHEAVSPAMMLKLAAELEREGDPRRAHLLRDAIDYHTTPVQAAEAARAAGAKLLAYSHVIPPVPNRIAEKIFLRGVDHVRTNGVVVAYDGLHLALPAGSDDIVLHDLR